MLSSFLCNKKLSCFLCFTVCWKALFVETDFSVGFVARLQVIYFKNSCSKTHFVSIASNPCFKQNAIKNVTFNTDGSNH